MAEQLFQNALTFNVEENKIEIDEKKISSLGISSARITNACIMAVVKACNDQQSTFVDVVYNNQDPQVIDIIAPKIGDKISINITEELNCLIKFAFQYSGNPEHDDKISILFKSKILLEDISLFVEYVPEQIMHENSAYVDYDVRQAGSGGINLATGCLRFNHQCGNGINLVYNNWETETRSTTVHDAQGKKTKFRHSVGKGFKLNVEQFLIKRKGTDNQSVYTYVDGDGNYHEFSEKYYYVAGELNGVKQKIFVPKSEVYIDRNGKLTRAIDENQTKEVLVERKTTNGLYLEQDYANFKSGKYIEERQQEQIELEENVEALARQLKQYVIVNKATGEKLNSDGILKEKFSTKTGKLSIAAYESFLNALTDDRLLLSEAEAVQFRSLLLQQTVKSDEFTNGLEIKSSTYNNEEYYSDNKNKTLNKNVFQLAGYNKMLIDLRKLVHDLRKDYATLIRKAYYDYSDDVNGRYLYEAYMDFAVSCELEEHDCFLDVKSASGDGKLNENTIDSYSNLLTTLGHINGKYCDLQLELDRINDDLNVYYSSKEDNEVKSVKHTQRCVERSLKNFKQQFSDRMDKLQTNINKFEAEINDFAEQIQGEVINRQILMLIEKGQNNKVDLDKYFKQYYNKQRELTQMNWQMPKYFVIGNDGVTMGFNKDGYLVVLFDNYENQTAIVYSKGRVSSVQDTDGNVTSFEYGKGKRIKKIITSDGKTYQLFYEKTKGLLTKITDGNGENTYLGYDSYGFLNSVEDNSRFGVQFNYDKYGRVVTVNQTSQINVVTDNGVEPSTAKQSKTLATIDYHDSHLTTSVTNELGLVTTYNFDILGKIVNMYEGQYSDPEETTRAKSFEYTDNKKSFTISDDISKKNLIADFLEPDEAIVLQGTKDGNPCAAIKSLEVSDYLFENGVTDYVLSVWAQADSAYVESARSLQYSDGKINATYGITNDSAKKNRKFEVRAVITYEDGECVTFVAGFDWLNTKWQYLAMPIEVKQGKKVTECIIILDYSYNVKSATFDCLSLHEGSWTYSEFDEEGKQTYSEDSASRTSTKYFYDDNDKLIKEELTDVKGRVFTSAKEYNARGSLVRSINYAGVVEETVFDEKGRALKKITYNTDDPTSKFYEESKRDDKGKVTADMDESGEYDSVTYTYAPNGEVAVQTDGKGNKTAFGYKDGNLVSISGSADGEETVNTMHRTASLLTKTGNGDTSYNYEYDCWGRNSRFTIAGEDYEITTQYSGNFNTTTKYADNTSVSSETDVHGNTVKQTVTYGDGASEEVRNSYDPETGKLTNSVIDKDGETVYNVSYSYDYKGNTVKEERDGQFALKKEFAYTADNDLESTTYTVGGKTLQYTYETDRTPDKRDAKVGLPCGLEQVLAYDGLGRTKEVALGDNLVKDIYYAKYGDHATNRVSSVWHGVNGIRKENTRYTYDKAGNIETVTENGKLIARYAYDELNRLVREDNARFGTFTYRYDAAGNILSKTEYAFTFKDELGEALSVKEYSYKQRGWKDQLLSFNGERFEYDVMGNPTTYRDRTLTWQGRRLLTFAKDGKSATYTYDFNGVRTSKTATDGTTTIASEFVYDGNNLIAEQRGTKLITYFYGVDGVAGFEYDNETYIYRKNVQGDITHIYKKLADGSLELVARYVYDAWGNHDVLDAEGKIVDRTASVIANINPFRYRGYYFDVETGLYYLQTRYYDPELGRFISSDSIEYLDPETLGGLNLYAYCTNNPIMYTDPNGTAKWWEWVLFGIGVALVVAAAIVLTVASGGAATGLIGAIAVGAAKGALIGAAVGSAVGIAGGAIYAEVTGADMGQSILSGFLMGFGIGAIVGAVIGGAVGGASYTNAANAWNGGEKSMLQHFTKHGKGMGYKNPVKYTKDALKIVKNGTYYSQKNAYVTAYNLTKKAVNYVGVTQGGKYLTTFSIRTLSKTVLTLLGLL